MDAASDRVDTGDGLLNRVYDQLQHLHLEACKMGNPDRPALAARLLHCRAARPTIMLLSHTAPTAARRQLLQDVVSALSVDYRLVVIARVPQQSWRPGRHCLLAILTRAIRPLFVVSLSGTRDASAVFLEKLGVTTVCIIDATADCFDGSGFERVVQTVSGLVFIDAATAAAALSACPPLAARSCHVLAGVDIARWVQQEAPDGAPRLQRMCPARIGDIALAAAALKAQAESDGITIGRSGLFDRLLAGGPAARAAREDEVIRWYLTSSRLAIPRRKAEAGRIVRRPARGFNPLAYASDAKGFEDDATDPFADFIRKDRPPGRWSHEVVTLGGPGARRSVLKVAAHVHLLYPELFDDFLLRLSVNASAVDLFVTTPSPSGADRVRSLKLPSNVHVRDVRLVPNLGRDVGPFLTAYGRDTWTGYDVIGHFHSKRSLHAGSSFGDDWRNFLWDHLVGSAGAALDTILHVLAGRRDIGLVFPEDPILSGIDGNAEGLAGLAGRLGLKRPIHHHFEFPVGNMFWARPAAIGQLWDLRLRWEDYPPEPIPKDGTVLHALERLPPLLAEHNGFDFVTTHVEGCLRV